MNNEKPRILPLILKLNFCLLHLFTTLPENVCGLYVYCIICII